MREPKKCPFCGEVPDHYESWKIDISEYGVLWRLTHACDNKVSVRISTPYCNTKAEAVDTWNKSLA